MTPSFDPYRALGVRREASDAEIKAAHRRLAKRFHPDAGGDHERFLRVQEAYRLLSDPLLRRDWDVKHAPGPLRADAAPDARRSKAARRSPRAPTPPATPGTTGSAEGAARRPRSSRAYTWSAADVPWWEEGTSENRRQPGRKRPTRAGPRQPRATPPPTTAGDGASAEAPNAFDVYNRSSGAAWSMAARAYFRRGVQDLPRRGTFQYEGTQVVTGARARTAAQAEARRRAAAASPRAAGAQGAGGQATSTASATGAPGGPSASAAGPSGRRGFAHATNVGLAHDARELHRVREDVRRRTNAASWPGLGERLLYALVAWAPIAIVIGFGGAAATGCTTARPACPAYLETAQAMGIALVLGLLVALPKLAYVAAVASVGALFVALGVVALMALVGVDVPLSVELSALVGGVLLLAYAATALLVVFRDPAARPWYAGPRP